MINNRKWIANTHIHSKLVDDKTIFRQSALAKGRTEDPVHVFFSLYAFLDPLFGLSQQKHFLLRIGSGLRLLDDKSAERERCAPEKISP